MSKENNLRPGEHVVSTQSIVKDGTTVAIVAVTNLGRVFGQTCEIYSGPSVGFLGWECVTPEIKNQFVEPHGWPT